MTNKDQKDNSTNSLTVKKEPMTLTVIKEEKPIVTLPQTLNFKQITVNQTMYIVLKELGKGGSANVYHCYDMQTKTEVAIKKVNLLNVLGDTFKEIHVLKLLKNCQRIIKMHD